MFPAARQDFTITLCSQQWVEDLIQCNTRRKRLSGTNIGNGEKKLSLFVNYVILNKENPGALQATRINKKVP